MPDLRTIAIVVFIAWIFIDGLAIFRLKTGATENRDKASLKVLMVANMLTWWFCIAWSYNATGATGRPLLQWFGLALLALGIAIRTTAIAQLGRFHTPNVAILGDHQLLESGLYRHVRHPSYFGALVAFLGFGFALGNWISLAAVVVVMPATYLFRMHEEDAALLAAFGDGYRAYCQRTKRLIPWIY